MMATSGDWLVEESGLDMAFFPRIVRILAVLAGSKKAGDYIQGDALGKENREEAAGPVTLTELPEGTGRKTCLNAVNDFFVRGWLNDPSMGQKASQET